MSNELVKIEFSSEQVDLIKSQIAPKASDNELRLFLYQARRTGLDPLTRQIYAIHRWNSQQGKEVMTIQTSIDGFRVIAERSGDYAGQDEPDFHEVEGKLISCKVTVYRFRGDVRYPAAVGVAYWDEYKQVGKDGKAFGLWAKMPHTMLSKVAEALALRKAYPQDLSGLYTSDEINQASNGAETQEPDLSDVPDQGERQFLRNLVFTSDLNESEKEQVLTSIEQCQTYKKYQYIQHNLENRQLPIDQITNPNQSDINKHLKKSVA